MELYLTHEGLWKYTKETPDADEFEIQQDQMARAKIGLMVGKECICYIKETKNAREAWDALADAYENADLNNKGQLLARLLSLKSDQFETMRQYVIEVTLTAQKLKDIGKEIDDELLATILLQGLSEKYATFRIAIENSDNALSTQYVKSKLLGLDDPKRIAGDCKVKRKEAKGPVKCRICGGNHDFRDCPDLSLAVSSVKIPNQDKPKKKSKGSSKGAKSNDDWIMESGDHADMSDRKDYPCFLMVARLTIVCLIKFFKLW